MWTERLCAQGLQANKFRVDMKACWSFSTQPATWEKKAMNYDFAIMWWHGKSTNLHIWELKVQTLLFMYHHKLSNVPACVSGWTAASRTPGYTPPSDTSPACGRTPSLPADVASTGGTWSARTWHQPANYITWVIRQDTVLLSLLHQLQPPLIKITLVLENGVCSTWLPEEREQFISTRWELICQFVCVCVCGGGAAECVLVLK